jgi:hypothetical protein
MSRTARVFLVLICGLAAASTTVAAPFFAQEPAAIPGSPFVAVVTVQSITTFPDGNRIVRTSTVRYFRDGQGRTRTEREGVVGEDPVVQRTQVLINDPVSGHRMILHPAPKIAQVFKGVAGAAVPATLPAIEEESPPPFALMGLGMGIGARPLTEASSAVTSLGQKSINGAQATGRRLVRILPSGAIGNEKPITSTQEQWVSADLGIPVEIIENSTVGGQITVRLTQLTRVEPDSSLFTAPADYKQHEISVPVAMLQRMRP